MDRVLALIDQEFSTTPILNGRGLVYITNIGNVGISTPLHRIVLRDTESNKQVIVATSSYSSTVRDGSELVDPRMCVIPLGMSRAGWMEYITRKLLRAYHGSPTNYEITTTTQFYNPNYEVSDIDHRLSGCSYKSLQEVIVV